MQDLRAAPRWSKTAGIVVLVVFGLVLIVAVFGGSVAMFQSTEEGDSLRTAIAAKFPNRDVSIVCLASGGYR